MMRQIIELVKDYMHERRIRRLQREFLDSPCTETQSRFVNAICRRSQAQVARMERQKGLI